MQRLENLVEMLQTKVLGLTDELSTIKGSPTTPRMHPIVILPSQPQYSDLSSPPQPTLFYTSPACSGRSRASSPRPLSQPQPLAQLHSYSSHHASPRSNKATASMITTPLMSAPSSRMPYPKSPQMQGSPILPVVLPLLNDVPEMKPSPQRRQQRTATAIPPPGVTYGGGMSFDDAYSLARESRGGEDLIPPVLAPALMPGPIFPPPSPPPAPVTLNLEQPGRGSVVIPRSPRPVRLVSPISPQDKETPSPKEPSRSGKMARPRRARTRTHQRAAEGNNASPSNATEMPPVVVVPPPYYPQDEILVIPEPPTVPRVQPPTLNQFPTVVVNPTPLIPALDVLPTAQDRQPNFPLRASSPVSAAHLQYYRTRSSEPSDLSRWPPYYPGGLPRPVFSQPPVRSQSSFPTLTSVYETPPPSSLFLPPPVSLGATSQAPYQYRRSWTPRTRGPVRLHSGATPPISVQAPAPPAPPPPVTVYPVLNGATGAHPTTRAYAQHFPSYEAPPTVMPSYLYGGRARRTRSCLKVGT
jgi:hypothetical protein